MTGADATPVRVIIMAGQSNMVGEFGLSELDFEGFDYALPQPSILYDYRIQGIEKPDGFGPLEPHLDQPGAETSTYSCELTFGRDLDQSNTQGQIAIIKVAVGGSNLAARWHPSIGGDLYDFMIDKVTRSLDDLVTMGYEPEIVGFGWIQGDGDLWVTSYVLAYEQNLHDLINATRTDLNAPDMHVMVSQTHINHNKPSNLVAIMRDAKANFCTNDHSASLIDTDDLSFRDNGIHFDGTGRLIIGQRMAAAFLADSLWTDPPCLADLNTDGTLNTDDIDVFVALFLAGSLDADFTGNGTLNTDDIDAFVALFIAGCP
ncbi:MAG: hypothetical protein DHS20C14_20750 [Phycisphaeraceae bacterium]|nr:MAG: hypothetical protein DHS20C14_20750 [Phycisphaeraceae bacterium]